jgi:uncharacterized membrane protein
MKVIRYYLKAILAIAVWAQQMLDIACYVTYTLLGEWINSVLWYRNPVVILWVMEGNYINWYFNMEKKSISLISVRYRF